MQSSSSDTFSLSDLKNSQTLEGLTEFIDLYDRTFTDLREREDPGQWKQRLLTEQLAPQPSSHILIARENSSGKLVGGLVFEYYQHSRCGLLTYLVVDQGFRNRGLAGLLINKAITILLREALQHKTTLQAIFAESENPAMVAESPGVMNPRERLIALGRLGALWLNFPYIQPRLSGGKGHGDHLLLLSFPLTDAADSGILHHSVITTFLEEFYDALGASRESREQHLASMKKNLSHPMPLRELPDFRNEEKPALELNRSSVCLHFIEQLPRSGDPNLYCPDISSMELDLLSLAYQQPRVCNTAYAGVSHAPVEIHYPDSLTYYTEGRAINLYQEKASCIRNAEMSVSQTTFNKAGIRIWHIALTPVEGEPFSEFDLIKLIHLYDGRSENTQLQHRINFTWKNKENPQPAEAFVAAVTGSSKVTLKGATIHISNEGRKDETSQHAELLRDMRTARADTSGETHKKLITLIETDEKKKGMLLAFCGIVTGIFDFREIDIDEALDTLEPTFSDFSSFIRIHRGTLISISESDRALGACWKRIGASPYLILPHAVLLHNEALVAAAEYLLDPPSSDLSQKPVVLTPQEEAVTDSLAKIDNNLQSANRYLGLLLPNIFNYVTERAIYKHGLQRRGFNDRLMATRVKLQKTRDKSDSNWNQRRENGQRYIAMLLAFLSLFEIKSILFADSQWIEFSVFAIVIMAVIYWIWGLGLSKSDEKENS